MHILILPGSGALHIVSKAMLLICGFANDPASACCRVNPTGELRSDGTTVHPYDAMFVKMKRAMIQAETPAALDTMRYQQWMGTAVRALHSYSCYVIAVNKAVLNNKDCLLHVCMAKTTLTCS